MLANNLISGVIPALKTEDKGKKALSLMDLHKVYHLPVVDGNKYLGMISDKLIIDLGVENKPIGVMSDKFITVHVQAEQHIFEVAILMYRLKLSVIAVLDSEHKYIGGITLYDLSRRFARYFSLQEVGGVIVLEVNVADYSLTEISRIVESNDTKILSFFLNPQPGGNTLELILKLDREDLSPVIQTFMRYNYNVKAIYLGHSMLNDLYKDRYDQFVKYMNI